MMRLNEKSLHLNIFSKGKSKEKKEYRTETEARFQGGEEEAQLNLADKEKRRDKGVAQTPNV